MTSLREWVSHTFYDREQSRDRNALRQHVLRRELGVTTAPPLNDPRWKWGVDIAGIWDGVIDAECARDFGCSFVIVKGADGTLTATKAYENSSAVQLAGLPLALYFWLYPDNCVSTKAQGQKWASIARVIYPAACLVDYEWSSFLGKPANPEESDLLSAVSWLSDGWKGPVGTYSSLGYTGEHPLSEKSKFLLWWAAQYGVAIPSQVYPFGANWVIWQQSDRWGPAAQWGIDPNFAHVSDGDVMTPSAFYSLFTGSDPEPLPDDEITSPWPGVVVTRGRRFDSDFEMKAVAPDAIAHEMITAPGSARIVEDIPGDIVSNGGDFDMTTYQAVGLLISEGRKYSLQADFEPALAFDAAGHAYIHSIEGSNWENAVGLKRYLVVDGAQAQSTSPAWDNREPRTIFGLRPDGTRLILSVKGRQDGQLGITLYQAADIMCEFGADRAGDGDGGDSVQSRVAGEVFVGTSNRRLVADFYTITIKASGGTMTQIIQGTAKGDVQIRQSPGGASFSPVRYLHLNDKIEADQTGAPTFPQWLHLTKINGVAVVGTQWASAGTAKQYIAWDWVDVPTPPPPPPPDSDDTFTASFQVEIVNNETGARYVGTLSGTLPRVS